MSEMRADRPGEPAADPPSQAGGPAPRDDARAARTGLRALSRAFDELARTLRGIIGAG